MSFGHYRRAYALDPVSMHAGMLLSEVLRVSGRVDEALQILSRASQLYPNNVHVFQGFASCHLQQKDFESARKVLEDGLRSNPNDNDLKLLKGVLAAMEGDRESALAQIRALSAQSETASGNARLFINMVLGNVDEAFAALDELARIHAWPFLVKSEPLLEGLRKDSRFADFCRKVGIPP